MRDLDFYREFDQICDRDSRKVADKHQLQRIIFANTPPKYLTVDEQFFTLWKLSIISTYVANRQNNH